MVISVNGEERICEEGVTLEQFVALQGYRRERIAVEVNGVIIPKAMYADCVLAQNDKLEVVTFVGGG